MRLLIVTGMSGSGKSCVMDVMEDIGYYCIDNIPPELIPKFVDICKHSDNELNKIAVAVDIRSGDMFDEIFKAWQHLKSIEDLETKILFISANDEVLIKRYKETRRKHPLDEKFNGNLHEAIKYERKQLSRLREIADYYIETSELSANQLKEQVKNLFLDNKSDSLAGIPVTSEICFAVSAARIKGEYKISSILIPSTPRSKFCSFVLTL